MNTWTGTRRWSLVSRVEAWSCGGIRVVNLYAWRATDPAELRTVADPVGPDNDWHLTEAARAAARGRELIVAGWGASADPARVEQVLALPAMGSLTALATTKDGSPGHPLYLRQDLVPVPYRPLSLA
uniref:DUF1643 domain-containing protein n=1 Tax=Nonomuraea sp. CA-251285 TaxID=3240002 RepID=UPI003F499D90